MLLGERVPFERKRQIGVPLNSLYFTAIAIAQRKTVVDRHRHAAYYNRHLWQSFQAHRYRLPWTTLNPHITGF